jgi:hypothetical protein
MKEKNAPTQDRTTDLQFTRLTLYHWATRAFVLRDVICINIFLCNLLIEDLLQLWPQLVAAYQIGEEQYCIVALLLWSRKLTPNVVFWSRIHYWATGYVRDSLVSTPMWDREPSMSSAAFAFAHRIEDPGWDGARCQWKGFTKARRSDCDHVGSFQNCVTILRCQRTNSPRFNVSRYKRKIKHLALSIWYSCQLRCPGRIKREHLQQVR